MAKVEEKALADRITFTAEDMRNVDMHEVRRLLKDSCETGAFLAQVMGR